MDAVAEAPAASSAAPAVPAAAPSSSPAVSSTPSSSPGTPSGAAPESTGAPSGATVEPLDPDNFNTLQDYAQALIDKRQAESATEAAPTTEVVIETPAATPAGDALPPDALVPDGGEPAPVAETAPAPTLEDLQKPLEGVVTLEGVPTVADLYEKISADPALAKAMNDAGITGQVFDTVRKLDHVAKQATKEVGEYKELAPTVEDARYQREQAINFMNVDNAFMGASTPQGAEGFLNVFREMAIVRDATGNPVPRTDAAGNPIPDGRGGYLPQIEPGYFKVHDQVTERRLAQLESQAGPDDTDLHAAIGVIRERMSPSSPAVDDLPEEQQRLIKASTEQNQRREQELNRRQQAQAQADETRFINDVGDESSKSLNTLILPALEKAQLSGFAQKAARQEIDSAILGSLAKNAFFQARMAELARYPLTAANKQQRVNLITSHVQSIAGPIIRKVLAQAAVPILEKKATIASTAAKVTKQIEATRSEPRATTGAVPAAAEVTTRAALEQFKTDYRAKNGGDDPSPTEIINWGFQRRRSA